MTTTTDSSNNNSSSPSSSHTDPPPPPIPMLTHCDLTVSNITNFIKITLSIEKVMDNTWSELFKIHARVFQVTDHIISFEPAANPSLKTTDPQLWLHIDVVVLLWIYGTILDNLLNAEIAWKSLIRHLL